MIRFCDREVCCVIEDELNRTELLNYFLDGHRNESVCVMTRDGGFIGCITYASLLGKEIKESIQKDYAILDGDIWKNARDFFSRCKRNIGIITLLPILNSEKQLICFAWQDEEANRELRMLDELQECENAFTFRDVFPEFDRVIVNGFNELAYYLVRYLEGIGMPVDTVGDLWSEYGFRKAESVLDYREFRVYAEGLGNLEEEVEFRHSVSAEFECVDQIYEENICKGIIRDADGQFSDLLALLRDGEKQIVIVGTGEDSLNAYDLLLKFGIDISCFISDKTDDVGKELFGKGILSGIEELKSLKNLVLIEPTAKQSAWGFGNLDLFYYFGYKRNKEFFLLQDYTEIPKSGLLNILKYMIGQYKRRVILMGDYWLCFKLKQILEEYSNEHYTENLFYMDVWEKNSDKSKLNKISKNETKRGDIYLLLTCRYYSCYAGEECKVLYHDWLLKKYRHSLREENVIDYHIENIAFMNHASSLQKRRTMKLKVKKIVIGSINDFSGHTLFRGALDNHPEIMLLHYSYLNNNLYSVCIRLAAEKSENIIALFWKIVNEEINNDKLYVPSREDWEEGRILKFNHIMKSMLAVNETFSSQELFVMIHIAYAGSWGQEITDISKMIIYWEPHMDWGRREELTTWLNEVAVSGEIVNVVRDACKRAGSYFRNCEGRFSTSGMELFRVVLQYPNKDRKEYDGWRRVTIRFEDLKCNSKSELRKLCFAWEIAWEDTLLETTVHGEKDYYGNITGFDLEPVYRTYEEYFSSFDRFRISLIIGPWQKQYNYPYFKSLEFNRRELNEMFLKDFRFEKRFIFHNPEEKRIFKNWVQRVANISLWLTRSKEIMEKNKNACSP